MATPTRAELAQHIAESKAAMLAALTPLVAQAFAAGLSSEAGRARDEARHAAWERSAGLADVAAELGDAGDRLAADAAEHARDVAATNSAMDRGMAPLNAAQEARWAEEEAAIVARHYSEARVA